MAFGVTFSSSVTTPHALATLRAGALRRLTWRRVN